MAWWVVQNVAIAAVLAAAVALVCRLTKIGPVARHALWLMVLVKLVTPPLVVWPWAVPDVFGLTALRADAGGRRIDAGVRLTPVALSTPSAGAPDAIANGTPVEIDRAADRSVPGIASAIWPWMLGIWAAGSLGVLGVEATRGARLARRVRAGAPADPAIAKRAKELAAAIGIRPVRMVTVAGLPSPAVWSFGGPVLMWPGALEIDTTGDCVDGLLVHELAHVKRGDHLIGWLELAAGIVWWWNPLFWIVRSALREQAELSCDAWVISALPHGRRAYAESLLALSGATAPRVASPSLVVVGIHATSRRVLERRLVMIMKGRAPVRLSLGALLAITLVAGATLPAWALGAAQQTAPPASVPATTPPTIAQTAPPAVKTPPTVVPPTATTATAPPAKARPPREMQTPKTAPPGAIKSVEWYPSGERAAARLPADGLELVQGFDKERTAILEDAQKKVDARRAEIIKSLEALQDQYTKAGKLDEAIAIRDYLRAGGPSPTGRFAYWEKR